MPNIPRQFAQISVSEGWGMIYAVATDGTAWQAKQSSDTNYEWKQVTALPENTNG